MLQSLHTRLVAGFILATTFILTGSSTLAQPTGTTAGTAELLNFKGCRRVERPGQPWGRWERRGSEIVMSRQLYSAVGYLNGNLVSGRTIEMICRLADRGQLPRFKTLLLSFGFSDTDWYTGEIQISVFSNGNYLNSTTVASGLSAPLPWAISIPDGTNFLAFEFKCLRSSKSECPTLYFFDDRLQ